MGKKGLTSIFSKVVDSHSDSDFSPPWPWPSCQNPKTTSFRSGDEPCTSPTTTATKLRESGEIYKTVNSVFFDSADSSFEDDDEEGDAFGDSFSTITESEESSEAVIRSLGRASTDRFFFEPGPTNSILSRPAAEAKAVDDDDDEKTTSPSSTPLVEESVAVAVDSDDPYRDFRASMEEMVAAHGLRGWAALEELLLWYLRINGKHNHTAIVAAFVDLLVGLAAKTSSSDSSITSTTATSCGGATTTATSATEQCSTGNGASCSSSTSCAGKTASDHSS